MEALCLTRKHAELRIAVRQRRYEGPNRNKNHEKAIHVRI